jgi:hypothetical protein
MAAASLPAVALCAYKYCYTLTFGPTRRIMVPNRRRHPPETCGYNISSRLGGNAYNFPYPILSLALSKDFAAMAVSETAAGPFRPLSTSTHSQLEGRRFTFLFRLSGGTDHTLVASGRAIGVTQRRKTRSRKRTSNRPFSKLGLVFRRSVRKHVAAKRHHRGAAGFFRMLAANSLPLCGDSSGSVPDMRRAEIKFSRPVTKQSFCRKVQQQEKSSMRRRLKGAVSAGQRAPHRSVFVSITMWPLT